MDKDNMNKPENAVETNPQTAPSDDKAPRDVMKKSGKKSKKSRMASIFHLKQLRYGSLSIVMTVIVIVLVMLVNYVFGLAESNFAWTIDLSYNQKFSISDATREVVQGLDEEVKIYTLLQENSTSSLNTMLEEMLNRYKALSDNISVQNLDIVANPTAAAKFQTDGNALSVNSIVVSNADETKFRVISSSDLYDYEYSYDYTTGQYSYSKYDFVGEQAVTSAILYVTSDDTPIVYLLQGHGEVSYDSMTHVTDALTAQNYEPMELNLTDSSVTLEAGDVVMVVAPTKDLTDAEYEILKNFLENGGRMYYSSQYGIGGDLPNFEALLGLYGLTVDDGLLVEDVSSSGRYYRQQLVLMPEIALTDEEGEQLDITKGFNSSSYVVLPECQAIRTPEMKQSGIVYTDVLTTSDKAYIKSNITENTTIDKQETDESGKFSVAVAMDKPDYENVENTTRIFVVGNAYFLASESYLNYYDNSTLLISPMEWLVNRDTSVYVPSKSMGTYVMSIPDNTTYQILTVTVIIVIPVVILLAGFIIWRRRRHL